MSLTEILVGAPDFRQFKDALVQEVQLTAVLRIFLCGAMALFLSWIPLRARSQVASKDSQGSASKEKKSDQSASAGSPASPADTHGGAKPASSVAKPATAEAKPAAAETELPPADAKPAAKAPDPIVPIGDSKQGVQTNRMFWVVPNFAAVSANTQLPRLSTKEKFMLATKDSTDYTAFIWAGMLAGQGMALNSSPELGQGMKGYSRYYWRAFADQASGAFFTEAIVPALMHEDPRYYTLGHGGFFRRTGYALLQMVVTKTDSGGTHFNTSELVGNGCVAGLSNLYYPPGERGFSQTMQNWGAQMESAALNNVIKEFWPDIRRMILRQKN